MNTRVRHCGAMKLAAFAAVLLAGAMLAPALSANDQPEAVLIPRGRGPEWVRPPQQTFVGQSTDGLHLEVILLPDRHDLTLNFYHAGGSAWIAVRLVNEGSTALDWMRLGGGWPFREYHVTLRDQKTGEDAPPTRHSVREAREPVEWRSAMMISIAPGGSVQGLYSLGRGFDLSEAGMYSLSVEVTVYRWRTRKAVTLRVAGVPIEVRGPEPPHLAPQVAPTWKAETGWEPRMAVSGNGRYVAVLSYRRAARPSPFVLTLLSGDGARLWEHEFAEHEQVANIAVTDDGTVFCDYDLWLPGQTERPIGAYRFAPDGKVLWTTKWTGKVDLYLWALLAATGPSGVRLLVAARDWERVVSAAVLDGDGQILSKFEVPASVYIGRAELAPDASYLLWSEARKAPSAPRAAVPAEPRLVARALDFSELWHVDGLDMADVARAISHDGKQILAQGVGPFAAPQWDPSTGMLKDSAGRYKGDAFGWAVLDSAGKPLWGSGAYEVVPEGYGAIAMGRRFDSCRISYGSIGGGGNRTRVLAVTGSERAVLALRGGYEAALDSVSLPPLRRGTDETMLSADGSRVACLGVDKSGTEADLSVFDTFGRALWTTTPGAVIPRRRSAPQLAMSDDGRLVLLLWGQTLYAFSEHGGSD